MSVTRLLTIDDEAFIQHALRKVFSGPEFECRSAETGGDGLAALKSFRPHVVVLDVHLPDATGLETFDRIRKYDARVPVILITGHGTTDLAIEATKRGAFDYLLKPLELEELRSVVERAAESAHQMNIPAVTDDDVGMMDIMVGQCPAMQAVYKSVGRVAPTNATVLIFGESGTGKELIARAIYQHSHRAQFPFLEVNCAAIPDTLLENELFGHEKGAFTGADRQRIGKFEQCTGGTIFLDEIGELSSLAQSKLLRLLQEQRFERLGGGETIQTDVRLIAATNADLNSLIAAGKFRQDLFFRLNEFTLSLPPLRERGSDLQLLIDYYIRRIARELGKSPPRLHQDAQAALISYAWPGNIRELRNVLKQALLHSPGSMILPSDLPLAAIPESRDASAAVNVAVLPAEEVRHWPSDAATSRSAWDDWIADLIASGGDNVYAEATLRMDREVLTRVLKHTSGNKVQAARILGISRNSLRAKIKALGIEVEWSEDEQIE